MVHLSIKEKLRKRIYFHGTNKESLLKLVDCKAVPKYMGGDLDLPQFNHLESWYGNIIAIFKKNLKVILFLNLI